MSCCTINTEHFDRRQFDLLRNAVQLASNSTSAVGSMAITIIVESISRKVRQQRCPHLGLGMSSEDAGVDNVRICSCTCTFIVKFMSYWYWPCEKCGSSPERSQLIGSKPVSVYARRGREFSLQHLVQCIESGRILVYYPT